MLLLQKNCSYTLIFYKVNSLTDNFISFHVGGIEPAVQTLFWWSGDKEGEKKEHEEKRQDNKMLRHRKVENTWVIRIINRDIKNAYGGHIEDKNGQISVNCRSAVNTAITHTYVHFFVNFKNVVPKCLAFIFLKRGKILQLNPCGLVL